MKVYSAREIRNIVIMGHSGSGKTTISESCLFSSGTTKRFGKVSEGNTVSDYETEEIRRNVSVNTSVIPIEWLDTKINFLDTPGYFDFAGEVKSAVNVADAALIVVSGKSGPEVGTEKAWEYAEKRNIPKLIFINFMDDENSNFGRSLEQMREVFGKSVAPFQIPLRDENEKFIGFINCIERDAKVIKDGALHDSIVPEAMKDEVESLREMIVEVAAESDDELLEKYFNDEQLSEEEIYRGLNIGIKNCTVAPVICGAAPLGYGIKVLMNSIVKYIPSSAVIWPEIDCIDFKTNDPIVRKNETSEPFSAYVFKTISDPYVGRLTIFRIMSGKLTKDKTIYNPQKDTYEKVSHIYILRGKEQIETDTLEAGDIGALAKLSNTSTQDTLCSKEAPVILPKLDMPIPVFSMALIPKGKGDEDKISTALSKIKEEDPTINIEINKETKQTVVSGLGEQHLDVLLNKLKNKYKIDIDLVEPIIPFREMIKGKVKIQGKYKKQSGGHGQFGDVWIEFEPSGDLTKQFIFEEKVFGGSVPKQYFPAVEKGLQDSINTGVIAGYPVVGLKATLVDGSYHPVDSSEMAFKMATSVAFKEGLLRANPVLLEPIAHMEVVVPEKYMGDVMGDINKRRGRIISMNAEGNNSLVIAEIPMSEIGRYSTDLRSMTQSRGSYSFNFERYEEAPIEIQQKIIASKAK